jgi:hypothetical protein
MSILINSLTPVDPVIVSGDTVTFIVNATDTTGEQLFYEWEYSTNGGLTYTSAGLFNNTESTFTTSPLSQNQSGIYFRVRVSNESGLVVNSNEVPTIGNRIVTVTAAPTIVILSEYEPSYTVPVGANLPLVTTGTVLNVNNSDPNVVAGLTVEWQYSINNGDTWLNINTATFSYNVVNEVFQASTDPSVYARRSTLNLQNITFAINNYRFRARYFYTGASNSPVVVPETVVLVNPTISIFQQPGQNVNDTKDPVQAYKTSIANSGQIRVSVGAFTTSGQTLFYNWEFAIVDYSGTLGEWFPLSEGIQSFWFRYRTGTPADSDVLQLDRTIYFEQIAFRVTISGSASELPVTSEPYYVYMKDVPVLPSPMGNKESLEDFYDPAVVSPEDRIFLSDFPIQTVTLSSNLDINRNTGLNGRITMTMQRKAPGASDFNDLSTTVSFTPVSDSYTSTPSTLPTQSTEITHTTPPLRINLDDQSQYRVKVTSTAVFNLVNGQKQLIPFYSALSTITVFRAVYITTQPADILVFNNQTGSFIVGATTTSPAPISYQWQDSTTATGPWQNIVNGGIYSGANTNFLTISPITTAIQRRFVRAIATTTQALSTATSFASRIFIRRDTFSAITALNDISIDEFDPISWTVEAQSESLGAITYQWQKSTNFNPAAPSSATWFAISGANSPSFIIPSVTRNDAGYYRCLLTSFGGETTTTNAAKLTVSPVEINIVLNLPLTLTFLEGRENERTLSVEAIPTRGPAATYQWQIKRTTDPDFVNFGLGFQGQTSDNRNFIPRAFDAITDNGAKIRCKIDAAGVPFTVFSNECTITVNRRFFYFADSENKNGTIGQGFVLDLQPSFTGGNPSYQWQVSTNNGGVWNNIVGETSQVLSLSNVTSGMNNNLYRCRITLTACTQHQYSRNNVLFVNSVNEVDFTVPVRLLAVALQINPKFYSKEIEKLGAAIGTVVCVPKPDGYINDPSANNDDIVLWKTSITGDVVQNGAVSSVVSSGFIYNTNKPSWVTDSNYRSPKWLLQDDRFIGFIELRGQWLLKSEFPILYSVLGDSYGSTSTLFKLPNPYGKKVMGTGNVNNNGGNVSIIPLYNADGTSGGDKNEAGSIGGQWNYSRSAQLPPGSPGDASIPDGTAGSPDPATFSIGNFVTNGFLECEATANTSFTGTFSFRVGPLFSTPLATVPPHTHGGVSAGYIRGYDLNFNGCDGVGTWSPCFYAVEPSEDFVISGPEGIADSERGIGHAHGLSDTPVQAGNSSSNHLDGIGDTSSNTTYNTTLDIDFKPGSIRPTASLFIDNVVVRLTNASRPIFNSSLRFFLRNNEELPVNSNYFRLKYMIKAY